MVCEDAPAADIGAEEAHVKNEELIGELPHEIMNEKTLAGDDEFAGFKADPLLQDVNDSQTFSFHNTSNILSDALDSECFVLDNLMNTSDIIGR